MEPSVWCVPMCQKVTFGSFSPDTTPGVQSRDPEMVPEHVLYPVFDDVFYPVFVPVRDPHYPFTTMFSILFSTRFRIEKSIITGYLLCFLPCFWPGWSRKKQFCSDFPNHPRHYFASFPMESIDVPIDLHRFSVGKLWILMISKPNWRQTGQWTGFRACFWTGSETGSEIQVADHVIDHVFAPGRFYHVFYPVWNPVQISYPFLNRVYYR